MVGQTRGVAMTAILTLSTTTRIMLPWLTGVVSSCIFLSNEMILCLGCPPRPAESGTVLLCSVPAALGVASRSEVTGLDDV